MAKLQFAVDESISIDHLKLRRYSEKKIAQIHKYVPKADRGSMEWSVHYKLASNKRDKVCHLSVTLPGEVLVVTESASHAYSSLDIANADMKRRLRDRKSKHTPRGLRHALHRAFKRQR